MTKEHVENLAGLKVKPVPWNPSGLAPGAQLRPLASDPETGGFSGLLELPASYDSGSAMSCDTAMRLFVIDGELQMGAKLLGPAGITHGPPASKNGNVNLCFTHGLLGIDYSHNPRAMDIIQKHLKEHPWT